MNYDLSAPIQKFVAELILFLPNLIVAIIIFLATLYVSSLAARAIRNTLEKRQADPELSMLLSRLARWSIIVLGVIWALQRVNFNVTGFVAGLGIAGFTIGFALKEVAENFVAGILLLLQQPFDIGDAIDVNGHAGVVTDIAIRATTMRTWDGLLVVVPNATVYTNAITNFSKVDRRRLQIEVGVGYETDLQKAHEVMLEVVTNLPGVIKDDPAPAAVFKEFGDSSINATLYFWFDTQAVGYFDTLDGAVKGIKTAFEKEGISIPFPIRTVYMQQH